MHSEAGAERIQTATLPLTLDLLVRIHAHCSTARVCAALVITATFVIVVALDDATVVPAVKVRRVWTDSSFR